MKKTLKRFGSFLLAMALALGMMAGTALAAGTGTITINNATKGNTYKVYKVFEADGNGTNIRYKLVDGKTEAPAGFTVDSAGNVTYTGSGVEGNLTADDISAIAAYVGESDLVATKTANSDSTSVTISNLPNGYYYITTTTGTAVTITSTNPDATVVDKNEAPKVDKKITNVDNGSFDADGKKALAQVGTDVTYTATIEVKNGAKNYVFHDKMDPALRYNSDVAVKIGNNTIQPGDNTYTVGADNEDTITIKFKDVLIANNVGNTITITYSAQVTSAALTTDPAKNTASISYGDNNTTISIPNPPEVYNAKITVTKTDGDGAALAGAGFVLKKGDLYYKLDDNGVVSWVSETEATELTTTKDSNVVAFTGLADGTYTLVENTVPAGYNKAADQEFTIANGDYTSTNLEKTATVINEAGSTLPSTGGMGTTIFYIVGGILVVGAGVLLITKKRMDATK